MVGPAGSGTICGGPTLLCKLQVAKEAARSPANANKVGSRLQDIAKEGGPGDRAERREEEVRMKELQSQQARIVAQMVPAQASRTFSPFEDTENIPISVSEDVHALINHLINQDAGIIAGRQVLTDLIKGLNSIAIPDTELCTLSCAIMCHQL